MPPDFFTRLVERTVRPGATVRPRLASPFVPFAPEPAPSPSATDAEALPRPDIPAPVAIAADLPSRPERGPDTGTVPVAAATREEAGSAAADGDERRRPALLVAASASALVVGDADEEHAAPARLSREPASVAAARPAAHRAVEASPEPRRPARSRPDDGDGAPAHRTPRPLLPAARAAARVEQPVEPDESDGEPAEPPVVRVDIGRIEVKAAPPPVSPGRVESSLMSLSDYLGGRGRSRR